MKRIVQTLRRCAVLAALAPLALAPGCGGEPGDRASGGAGAPAGPPPPVVEVVRVAPRPFVDQVELLGQLEPEESVVVHSEVPGVIESIGFEEGDWVKKGQVLFRLRDAEQRARLHEAKADLAEAADNYHRTRDLVKRKVVAEAQLEGVSAALEAAQARVEVAQVELDRTQIRAPFDALAGARLVSPGARIEEKDDLVKVEAIRRLELVFTLPELALPLARVGMPVEISVAPYPNERFHGEIFFVAPSLNPQNRRLLVKGRIDNDDLRLRPGLFAKVHARIGGREDAILLPEDAVVYGAQGSFVWRVDENDVTQPVDVKIGMRNAGKVEVVSGLAAGDVVVVAGTNKLSPGMRVEAVASPEAVAEDGGPQAVPGSSAPPEPGGSPAREPGGGAG